MSSVAGDGIMSSSGTQGKIKKEPRKSLTPTPTQVTAGQGEANAENPVTRNPSSGTSLTPPSPRLSPTTVEIMLSPESSPSATPRLKGILKNKLERSPVAPNALNYQGPESSATNLASSLADNNTEEDQRFSRVVDSKDLYRKRLARKKEKYVRARFRSTDDLPNSFRPKRRDDNEPDEEDHDQTYKPQTA